MGGVHSLKKAEVCSLFRNKKQTTGNRMLEKQNRQVGKKGKASEETEGRNRGKERGGLKTGRKDYWKIEQGGKK